MNGAGRRRPPAASFLALLTVALIADGSAAIPRRGIEPWSMILCKFADLSRYEPRDRQWFQQWLAGDDAESITTFFSTASNGVYTIAGSTVHGWYTLPYTQRDVLRLADSQLTDALGSDSSFNYFEKIKELCVEAALRDSVNLHRQKITVINAGTTAVYGKRHGVLLTPPLMFSAVLTHEMIHSFFIGHSYSDRKIRVFPYALSGEYDDRYDLMSTANAYMHRSRYGMTGPGLNGAHLNFLGWLPIDRILYFGRFVAPEIDSQNTGYSYSDSRQNYTLRLSSLSVPHNETRGWLLVMIPYDRDDPGSFYTLEFRTPQRVDTGILQASVLVHRVQKVGDSYYSMLLSQARDFYELTENTEWVKFLEPNAIGHFQLIRVTVRQIHANDADVFVSSTFDPMECRHGEIENPIAFGSQARLSAVPPDGLLSAVELTDPLAITTSTSQPWTSEEPTAKTVEFSGKPTVLSTPATPSVVDAAAAANLTHVCLDKLRAVLPSDLRIQMARWRFYAQRETFGANACRDGFVWRAIDAYDYVCVPSARRDAALAELSRQNERVSVNGTGCAEPFVMRRAFPGDEACVAPAERWRTVRENALAARRLQYFTFFNGADTVGQ